MNTVMFLLFFLPALFLGNQFGFYSHKCVEKFTSILVKTLLSFGTLVVLITFYFNVFEWVKLHEVDFRSIVAIWTIFLGSRIALALCDVTVKIKVV